MDNDTHGVPVDDRREGPEDAALPVGRFARLVPVALWLGVIFYQSSRSTLPFPPGLSDRLVSMAGHFVEYAVLAGLLWWGISHLLANGRTRVLVVLGVALVYAISDEWHQSFVPGRTPDVWDVVVDMIGAMAGIVVTRWMLQKMTSRRENARSYPRNQ